MIKFLSKAIFSDRDQNGSDLHKKIDGFQPDTTNLRHDWAQIWAFFDETLCVSLFHEYNCMIKFWGQNSKNWKKRSG